MKGIICKQKYLANYWVESQEKKYALHESILKNSHKAKCAWEYEGKNCDFAIDKFVQVNGYDGVVEYGSLVITT